MYRARGLTLTLTRMRPSFRVSWLSLNLCARARGVGTFYALPGRLAAPPLSPLAPRCTPRAVGTCGLSLRVWEFEFGFGFERGGVALLFSFL